MKYLDNNNNRDNLYVFDIETDSLNPTSIWCCVFKCLGTQEKWRFIHKGGNLYDQIKQFIQERPDGIWIGHNSTSFDCHWVSVLCNFPFPYDRTIDTLVLSYLWNPALEGGHSLGSYGLRLGFPKDDFNDWTKFSPEMLSYCERDVDLTEKVFDALVTRMNRLGYSELSCKIEHKIRKIVDEQQRNGFYFNIIGAESLHNYLRGREADLSEEVHRLFPPKLEEVGRYTRRRLKDGSDTASFKRHVTEYPQVIDNGDSSYSVLDWVPFNIGSPQQRLKRLLALGYIPTEKTKKGNPRIDEDSLLAYSEKCGRPEIKAMAEWLVCNGRANMVETWLKFVDRKDNRIHGEVFTCGATTRRMRHRSPNTANIPSEHNGAKYGRECRSLWGVPPEGGRVLVGYDAKGLETVGLCHYLNNPEATKILTEGDIHTLNMEALTEALGFSVARGGGGAKTLWYGFIYGAYDKKLGEILKKGPKVGTIVRETLVQTVPGLKKLIQDTSYEFKASGGILRTVDGGFVRCPSLHAALNYKVQSLGGIVMKLAAILLDEKLKEKKVEFKKVGDIHDEGQIECYEEDAERIGQTAVRAIEDAARILSFNVPLTGDYKVGKTWAETH